MGGEDGIVGHGTNDDIDRQKSVAMTVECLQLEGIFTEIIGGIGIGENLRPQSRAVDFSGSGAGGKKSQGPLEIPRRVLQTGIGVLAVEILGSDPATAVPWLGVLVYVDDQLGDFIPRRNALEDGRVVVDAQDKVENLGCEGAL